ncbi:MAG TPA: glutamine-hydrolyzing GMP synthase, partial [Caulobacteraceae bacterium]|nr:glutamine-hydrolyzing GMP synthase [Caulobacteraceae bacterium]
MSERHERVLIVDFGSQVTQLIARRVREDGVYSEIHPFDRVDAAFLDAFEPDAIILSGGPASAGEAESPAADAGVFDRGVPVLGICYGEMTMCAALGGSVEGGHAREFGRADIQIERESSLLDGLGDVGDREPVWMSHGDKITAIPLGFEVVATSVGSPFAAIADEGRRLYGVQFHPEVAHTPRGGEILANFLFRICGCAPTWTMAGFAGEAVAAVEARVGPKAHAVCGLSGGVDSSVAAALVLKAIGTRLTCIFVDTGLQRAGEAAQVEALFRDAFKADLRVV